MVLIEKQWPAPPAHLTLGNNEVHVWRVALDRSDDEVELLGTYLCPEEQARAGRFHYERDRQRFVVVRALLRVLLSRYVALAPAGIQFAYGPYGKPALASGQTKAPLRFNLSHSWEMALYAFTSGRDVGIDIEYNRTVSEIDEIASRFFSPREAARLLALPPDARQAAFFRCWTRKEAYLKALGDGLTRGLDQFDVSLSAGEPARLLRVEWDAREVQRWSMMDLAPAPGYTASLAVEGDGLQLTCWQWTTFVPLPR